MSVRISIKVHPRAKRTRVTGRLGNAYKIDVACPPVGGRANDACIEFLAEMLRIPRSAVRITSGSTGRMKTVEIDGITEEAIRSGLGS
jgi:uncharacterized protein